MRQRQRQLVRAWLVAGTASSCGAVSHLLAGGHLPHPLIWALATSLAAFITLLATRLNLTRLSLATGVLAGQGILHGLYSHGHPPVLTANEHLHTGHTVTPLAVSSVPAEPQSIAMWVGHLLAAFATYALLVYGEQMLTLLRALLGVARGIFTRVHRCGYLPVKRYLPVFLSPHRLHSIALGLSQPTRGPPALAYR